MRNRLIFLILCFFITLNVCSQNQLFTTNENGWHYNECVLADIIKRIYGDDIMVKMISEEDYKNCKVFIYYSSPFKSDSVYVSKSFHSLTNDIYYKERIIKELKNQKYLYTIVPCNIYESSLYPSAVILSPCRSLIKYDYKYHFKEIMSLKEYINFIILYYSSIKIELMQDELLHKLTTKSYDNNKTLKNRIKLFILRNKRYFKAIDYYDLLINYFSRNNS